MAKPVVAVPKSDTVSDLAELEDIAATLDSFGGQADVAIPEDDGELAAVIGAEIAHQCRSMAVTAFKLAALKLRAGHGKWLPLLGRHGVNERTARRYLQLADFVMRLPQAHRPRFVGVSVTKLPALARMSNEDLATKAESGELDELAAIPRDELTDLVRKLKKKVSVLEHDKDGLSHELKESRGSLRARYENLKMPDFAAHARQESVALAEQMSLSVAAFEELIGERLSTDKEAKLYPEWVTRSAGTAYHSLRSVHARTQMLLERMEEQYGPEVTGKVDYEHTLSDGELLIARDSLAIILKRHKTQAENREADRANAKGGRGRPRSKKAVD